MAWRQHDDGSSQPFELVRLHARSLSNTRSIPPASHHCARGDDHRERMRPIRQQIRRRVIHPDSRRRMPCAGQHGQPRSVVLPAGAPSGRTTHASEHGQHPQQAEGIAPGVPHRSLDPSPITLPGKCFRTATGQ
jgi:hypothetical protein